MTTTRSSRRATRSTPLVSSSSLSQITTSRTPCGSSLLSLAINSAVVMTLSCEGSSGDLRRERYASRSGERAKELGGGDCRAVAPRRIGIENFSRSGPFLEGGIVNGELALRTRTPAEARKPAKAALTRTSRWRDDDRGHRRGEPA